jgi:hypothetical protein
LGFFIQCFFGFHVRLFTPWFTPPPPPPPPAFGLIYMGAIDKPRKTTSLCDPLLFLLPEVQVEITLTIWGWWEGRGRVYSI